MADINAESIQQRIQIARRDAEALKDRIKRKKDELADTTRECHSPSLFSCVALHLAARLLSVFSLLTSSCSPRSRPAASRPAPSINNEDEKDTQRTFGQDLCHALVNRQKTPSFSIAGRKIDNLGCIHDKQGARNTSTIIVGHDLRILP
jgi:guanine nucleotide-binding protein G(I)/G(S)/G(T) subunit beta-1